MTSFITVTLELGEIQRHLERYSHNERRVQELLEANNAELERRRQAEQKLRDVELELEELKGLRDG